MSPVPARNSSRGSCRTTVLACVVIVLAALAAYHNSFSGPFVFDDAWSITTNPSIQRFAGALSPPADTSLSGRPILNLTFALNYALAGLDVRGYHALNLFIHVLAGLMLFGILRRTLLRPALNVCFGAEAVPLALAVAVIWTVHPLQTEAVTYISQRAESLMGLFYLLTLYGFIRSTESSAPACWQILSVLACLLGVLSKEIIVTVPVIVLLYDRTFVAGSFREAWRLRWQYYLGLAGTWLLLARLMTGLGQQSVGFDQGVTWWNYALTSCRSVVLYLKLAVWPHPLVFDYGTDVVHRLADVVPYGLILAGLLAATAIAWWRRPAIGFAGAWFFVILAPASSVIPVVGQPMAEHRMYLPLAAVVTGVVLGLYAWMGRRSLIIFAAVAVGLGWLTIQRNKDYRSDLAIWSDTVAKRPDNERAHSNFGGALINLPGCLPEAISEYEAALRIKPDYPDAHNNLGCALLNIPSRLPEAINHFETAFRLKPDYVKARNNLGVTLYKIGRNAEAIVQFEEAVRIKPDYAEAHYNLGVALDKAVRVPESMAQFKEAVRIDPDYAEAHYSLGTCFARRGQIPEAIVQFREAVRLKPDYLDAHKNLGIALAQAGRISEAIAQCEEVLRIKPDSADARAFMERLQKAAR